MLKSYAETVLRELLKLRKGDALSVNTEESDFNTAKVFASEALKITDVQVKIVITDNGKPINVVEFEPEKSGKTAVSGYALLRITPQEKDSGIDADNYPDKDDLISIQKFHHLAEPVVFNRRLSIPFCVVPAVPVSFKEKIADRILVTDYRMKFLNHLDVDRLHFTGENTDFTVSVPSYGFFNCGHLHLPDGRDFASGLDFEKITATLDKNSIDGSLCAQAEIFGRKQKIILTYENGNLTSFSPSVQLEKLISYDSDAVKPGFAAMCDKCFELHLGGALLENFVREPEEGKLPESFNTSLYCLKLVLPDDLCVFYGKSDAKEKELVRKGFFLD